MKYFKLMIIGVGLIPFATIAAARKDDLIKKSAIGKLEEGADTDILGDVDPLREWNNQRLFEEKRFEVRVSNKGEFSESDKQKWVAWTALIAAHRQMLGEAVNHAVLDSLSPYFKTFWPKRAIAFAFAQEALNATHLAGIDHNSPEYKQGVLDALKGLKVQITQMEKMDDVKDCLAIPEINPLTLSQAHVFNGLFLQGEALKNAYLDYLTRLIEDFEKRKKNDDGDGNGGAPSSPMMADGR